MTESQRIVLNWRAKLKASGWPEENIRDIVQGLCEAGYRACLEELQERSSQKERIIANAVQNVNGVQH
jgi:hypothetical protein